MQQVPTAGAFDFWRINWYNLTMRNWSVDTTCLQENAEALAIWRLQQQLNYGLAQGEKLSAQDLRTYLPRLKIDQDTLDFVEFLLYGKRPVDTGTKKVS